VSAQPIDDGGSAFPNKGDGDSYDGMTLRDYFAAAALTGSLSSTEGPASPDSEAKNAFKYADAMLAERAKRSTP